MHSYTWKVGQAIALKGAAFTINQISAHEQIVLTDNATGAFSLHQMADLLNSYRRQELSFLPSVTSYPVPQPDWTRPLEDLPEKQLKAVLRCKFYLDYLGNLEEFCSRSTIQLQIQQAGKSCNDPEPPHPSTVFRWHRKLINAGGDYRVLIPQFHRRGPHKPRIGEEITHMFLSAVEEVFERSPCATMSDIEERLHKKIRLANLTRPTDKQLKPPHISTLYRKYDQLEGFLTYSYENGKNVAKRKYRLVRKQILVSNILERVEIDHTQLDIFLVCDETGMVLGKATLTLVVDCYSRMPLGYYISFGGGSTQAVMGALRHAILPKEPAKAVIPGLIVQNHWPCYGLFYNLVTDNGPEFHSLALASIALDLGFNLVFCRVREPWLKGTIERLIKTVNYSFVHKLPGTSMAYYMERGEYKPEEHALLTLGEFKHAFEKWLLDIYAHTVHSDTHATPWARWQEGLLRHKPRLPADMSVLNRRIGKVIERMLRREGFEINHIRYSSPVLEQALRQFGFGIKYRICYNPEDLGSIEVWLPNSQDPLTIPAVDQRYAKGLTELQHKHIIARVHAAAQSPEDREVLMTNKIAFSDSIDTLQESKKQRNRHKAAHLKGKTSSTPEREFTIDATATPCQPTGSPPHAHLSPIDDLEEEFMGSPIGLFPVHGPQCQEAHV
ncbi:putative transposase [Vogesella indigofera]|uniref:Putative transposase n=1 Tax=Vogesella indigofera TaxID=45465 RepID=A0A495AY92_VOGIN|nr:Mu transposase C-terminal domain-containing protein [Vogesella indigofera]RKQ52894.1 putative transposase [Vogesella indigofera]